MLSLEEIQTLAAQGQTLGEREGILYRQPHVGHAELGLDAAVLELHGAVDNRLRMDQHLNLLGIDTEEPLGLYDLEALVHHRSGVDGDLGTHVPGGVPQSVGFRHVGNLLHRLQTERTATGCQQNLFYWILIFANQTLEDG